MSLSSASKSKATSAAADAAAGAASRSSSRVIHSLTCNNVEVEISLFGTNLMLQNMSLHYMTFISLLVLEGRIPLAARKVASLQQ